MHSKEEGIIWISELCNAPCCVISPPLKLSSMASLFLWHYLWLWICLHVLLSSILLLGTLVFPCIGPRRICHKNEAGRSSRISLPQLIAIDLSLHNGFAPQQAQCFFTHSITIAKVEAEVGDHNTYLIVNKKLTLPKRGGICQKTLLLSSFSM